MEFIQRLHSKYRICNRIAESPFFFHKIILTNIHGARVIMIIPRPMQLHKHMSIEFYFPASEFCVLEVELSLELGVDKNLDLFADKKGTNRSMLLSDCLQALNIYLPTGKQG